MNAYDSMFERLTTVRPQESAGWFDIDHLRWAARLISQGECCFGPISAAMCVHNDAGEQDIEFTRA